MLYVVVVGHRGLQCLTSGTLISYRSVATGGLPECMEIWPRETPGVTLIVSTSATVNATDSGAVNF